MKTRLHSRPMPDPALRFRARFIPIAVTLLGFAGGGVGADPGSEPVAVCDDPIDEIVKKAKAQWPEARPYWLSPDWVRYFVLGYNDQKDRARDLVADSIVVFPMDETYATWYIIASVDNCMTFWIDLSPSKAYHLVEVGHALAEDL